MPRKTPRAPEAILETVTTLAALDTAEPPRKVGRAGMLTPSELAYGVKLHLDGLTYAQIGRRLNVRPENIKKALKPFTDTRDLATLRLRGASDTFAQKVIGDATVEESLEVLHRLGVLERRAGDKGGGLQIMVGVSLDGHGRGDAER